MENKKILNVYIDGVNLYVKNHDLYELGAKILVNYSDSDELSLISEDNLVNVISTVRRNPPYLDIEINPVSLNKKVI